MNIAVALPWDRELQVVTVDAVVIGDFWLWSLLRSIDLTIYINMENLVEFVASIRPYAQGKELGWA